MGRPPTVNLEVSKVELAVLHTGLQFIVLNQCIDGKLRASAADLLIQVTRVVQECGLLTSSEIAGLMREAQRAISAFNHPLVVM